MSVVAWDGKIIAADRMIVSADMRSEGVKLIKLDRVFLAWVGEQGGGLALFDWYTNGCHKSEWPEMQKTNDWTRLIVVDGSGVRFYEREPYAQSVTSPFMAWGSGRDFAMGVMATGADAIKAVEITNKLSTTCGMGVDFYEVEK